MWYLFLTLVFTLGSALYQIVLPVHSLIQVYKYWILAWFYRYFWKLSFSCFYFRQFRSQICVFWAYGPLGGPPWVLRGASFFIKIHRKYVCFEHMGPSGGPRKIEKLTLCFLGGPRGALGAPLGSLLGHFPFCLRAGGWREAQWNALAWTEWNVVVALLLAEKF